MAALRHLLDDQSIKFYVCPLCLTPYDHNSIEDGSLTDEDPTIAAHWTSATGGDWARYVAARRRAT